MTKEGSDQQKKKQNGIVFGVIGIALVVIFVLFGIPFFTKNESSGEKIAAEAVSESLSEADPEENPTDDTNAKVTDNNGILVQNNDVTSVSGGDLEANIDQNMNLDSGSDSKMNSASKGEQESDDNKDQYSELDEIKEPELFEKAYWKQNHPKVKGIYVTGPMAGSSGMKSLIELCDQTELNAMVIDIKDENGNITFRMPEDSKPAVLGNCKNYIEDMDALMKELKEHEIYTIARIVCFKDPALAKEQPELAIKDKNGRFVTDSSKLAWVNPCKEETWEYLTDIALYCADLGFDEIQFDYVRFPVGIITGKPNYEAEVTNENKHTYINDFLLYATERLHEKKMPVTADLFGTVIGNPKDAGNVGQDYAELSATVDAVCPMIYPSHYSNGSFGCAIPDAKPYETIKGAMDLSVEELASLSEEECAVVRPWLQDFTASWVKGHISYGIEEVQSQIQAVNDAGYEEWILWNAKNQYSIKP